MMKFNSKLRYLSLASITILVLTGYAATPMELSNQEKPGFSNISNFPLPESANLNMDKSMIEGGGDAWTGHLVYDTDKPHEQVVDFVMTSMQDDHWSKLSEPRAKETVLTFMKDTRLATFRIVSKGYMNSKTVVSVDMSNSKMRTVMVPALEETDYSS